MRARERDNLQVAAGGLVMCCSLDIMQRLASVCDKWYQFVILSCLHEIIYFLPYWLFWLLTKQEYCFLLKSLTVYVVCCFASQITARYAKSKFKYSTVNTRRFAVISYGHWLKVLFSYRLSEITASQQLPYWDVSVSHLHCQFTLKM